MFRGAGTNLGVRSQTKGTSMTIALTGGSGHLGRIVAETLLARTNPSELVVTTRNPAGLADLAARGVDVRAADFDDPDSLATAFAGVDRLLLISTDVLGEGTRTSQHARAIDAAVAAGVKHVIYTSLTNPAPANPVRVIPDDHRSTEEHLRASGLTWTALRNNIYADGLLAELPHAIATGTWYTNNGDGAAAYVTREDCGRIAAAVLAAGGFENSVIDVTGPVALTAADIGAAVAEVTGKPLEVVTVDDAAAVSGLVGAGLPELHATVYSSFGTGIREDWFSRVSPSAADITGTRATDPRAFLAANRDALIGA